MFSCVWLHFKKCFEKYFLIFGCVLENTIENTFSTCCSHFLKFSWLPNEYIISFIPQNTNKTQKKIIKFEQTNARSRSARSQSERSALRAIVIVIDTFAQWVDRDRVKIDTSRKDRSVYRDRRYRTSRWCRDRFFLSPSLSLSLSLFYFPRPEVIWSENRNGKSFPLFWLSNLVNWKCFSVLTEFEVTTKHPHFPENHFRNQFEVNSNAA